MKALHLTKLGGLVAAALLSTACPYGDAVDGPVRIGGDAIMLSNNTAVAYDGSAWTFGATGVTANVIAAAPSVADKFERVSDTTLIYEGVALFSSVEGPAELTLSSSLQTATASWNAGPRTYTINGLVGAPAFGASDSLAVTATVDGSPVTVTVPAPAEVGLPEQVFGPPAGWDTTVSFPDGGFDTLYVFVATTGGSGTGEAGLMRFVPAEDMTAGEGRRSATLMDAGGADALAARGLVPSVVYVAAYNEDESDPFFGLGSPVQAGRMFQLDPLALGL